MSSSQAALAAGRPAAAPPPGRRPEGAAARARASALRALTGRPRAKGRRINLALQGGGAHGAFTWGALDRLLEEPDLEIAGVSGTSAGAMNGAALASGLAAGGREGARAALAALWRRIAEEARRNPLAPTALERATGLADAGLSAGRLWLDEATRVASPYALNPSGHNPLRAILADTVDFGLVGPDESGVRLFVCATAVRTGKPRVFGPGEVTLDAVLASACLPRLFHAVEIDGEPFWDGGFSANPALLPLVEGTDRGGDIVIVQVDPLDVEELPTTARAIRDRVQVLGFNAGFVREMQAIATLLGPGERRPARGGDGGGLLARAARLWRRGRRVLPPPRLHMIEAAPEMGRLGAATRLDPWDGLLAHLFGLGRRQADAFLAENGDAIGARPSLDVAARFL